MASAATCTARMCPVKAPRGDHRPVLKGWAGIALAVAGLILFIYVIGPMGLQTDTLKPMADFIEENNINANAYYYTEVDEFFDAQVHMREYLKLVPGSDR